MYGCGATVAWGGLEGWWAAPAWKTGCVVDRPAEGHKQDMLLVIGRYLDQLGTVAGRPGAPMITGRTPVMECEDPGDRFRRGLIPVLVISKVGKFAFDLPDANVAIRVSGTFGPRPEGARRPGRILGPSARRGPR